MYML